MASFNQSERHQPPISPEDNEPVQKESAMKLIANFGVTGKFHKRKGFWRKLCCVHGEKTDDDVVDMNVPVQNLNKRLHIVVNCRNTKINIRLHPQNENEAVLLRGVDIARLNELLSATRHGERGEAHSCSTRFSTPFLDAELSFLDCDVDTENRSEGNCGRNRTKTI